MTEKRSLTEALKKYFGFDKFKGDQEQIIQNLLDGNDTFVLMPTGGGKSLCYQLPSKTWSVQLMYKRYFKSYDYTSAYHSFQLTGVWGLNFANKKCTFSGFIDFWRGENWRAGHEGHGMLVILTEPQFWYNVTPNLSFGSEIEISNNFIYNTYNDKSFFINPTVAFKWNF